MGCGPTFQGAMDDIKEGGIHAWGWSGMDSSHAESEKDQLNSWRDSSRLYVLANKQT